MPTLRVTTFIERRPSDVFAFVSDQENAVKWQGGLVEVRRITNGPIGPGTRHAFTRKVMGRRMVAENEYVAYVPGESVTFRTVAGPLALQASYRVVAARAGTELTCTMELEKGRGLAGLFLPLIAKNIQKQMNADFATLKSLLESSRAV